MSNETFYCRRIVLKMSLSLAMPFILTSRHAELSLVAACSLRLKFNKIKKKRCISSKSINRYSKFSNLNLHYRLTCTFTPCWRPRFTLHASRLCELKKRMNHTHAYSRHLSEFHNSTFTFSKNNAYLVFPAFLFPLSIHICIQVSC